MAELNQDPDILTARIKIAQAGLLLHATGIDRVPAIPEEVLTLIKELEVQRFAAELTGYRSDQYIEVNEELTRIALDTVEELVRDAHRLAGVEFPSGSKGLAPSCEHEDSEEESSLDDFLLWEEEIKADGFTVLDEEGDLDD